MLKGLEVSEVRLSVVQKASYSNRWDSTYFLKEFLKNENIYSQWEPLAKLCKIKSGTTPKDRDEDLKNGVILLKTTDIRNNVLQEKGADYFYINENCNKTMLSSELKANDVLINIVGATTDVVGRVAFVPSDFPKANITQAMSFLRVIDKKLNPSTLFVFLQTKYGIKQTRRIARPTGQYNINNVELGSFRVPLLPPIFQEQIEQDVKAAHLKLSESKTLYSQAEYILLNELGLRDWQGKNEAVSIKRFSDFTASGRLDAKYYQRKYEDLEDIIKSVSYNTIADLQTFNARGVQPEYITGGNVSVVNSQNILENGLDYDNFEKTSFEFLKQNERAMIRENDILIYTTGSNIGRAQPYLLSDIAVASNHVNILRLEGVNPIYAALVLNSKVGRLQTEKAYTGSGQVEIYPTELEKFLIPILPKDKQEVIAEKVKQSFAFRTESKELMEMAKKKVEDFIFEMSKENDYK